jgi:hypothetical protein
MSNHTSKSNTAPYYYIPAILFGILTAWVVTDSFPYMILGALLGLLTAGFFVNVVSKSSEEV